MKQKYMLIAAALFIGNFSSLSATFAANLPPVPVVETLNTDAKTSVDYKNALKAYTFGDFERALDILGWDDERTNILELQLIGAAYGQLRRYDRALVVFERIIKLEPKNQRAWYNKGVTLEKLVREPEAIEAYRQCILIDEYSKKAGTSYSALGKIYQRNHKPQSAVLFYLKASQIMPVDEEIHFLLGVASASAKDWEQANFQLRELQQLRSPLVDKLQDQLLGIHPRVF